MTQAKLTPEAITQLIAEKTFMTHGTLTICVLTLTHGATVTGESNCIDPDNYDAEIGREMAFKDAFGKIWQLEGYAMKRDLHRVEES